MFEEIYNRVIARLNVVSYSQPSFEYSLTKDAVVRDRSACPDQGWCKVYNMLFMHYKTEEELYSWLDDADAHKIVTMDEPDAAFRLFELSDGQKVTAFRYAVVTKQSIKMLK